MKKNYTILLFTLLLILVGCKKDNLSGIPEGALLLTTESFAGPGGAKTSVSGTSVQWDNGDQVLIRDTVRTVTVNTERTQAYIEGFKKSTSGVYYGYCPHDITVSSLDADSAIVTVPSIYECHYTGGRQVIKLPLIGKANYNDDVIRFRHVTAAVKLDIMNSTGVPVVLDSVVVSSLTQKLSGSCGVTISVGGLIVNARQGGDLSDADRKVKVLFTDTLEVATGGIKEVQVPILPITAGENDITISIYSHATGAAPGAQYIFSRPGNNPTLARNEMMTAKIALSDGGGTHPTGLIPVNPQGQKVIFSQANLSYQATSGTWRFHDYQWDFIGTGINSPVSGSNNENIAQDYTGWIDLFGWGTSNYNEKYAWMVSTTDGEYGNGSDDIAGTYYDWGKNNPISNGGNVAGMWRTLTSAEWNYVLNQRGDENTPRYIKAVIGETHHGVIIFPEGYVHPNGCGSIDDKNTPSITWSSFTVVQWEKMQSLGAVFLPTTGHRNGSGETSVSETNSYGYYWSATHGQDNQKAQRLYFYEREMAIENTTPRHLGNAVRLVMDVVPGQSN